MTFAAGNAKERIQAGLRSSQSNVNRTAIEKRGQARKRRIGDFDPEIFKVPANVICVPKHLSSVAVARQKRLGKSAPTEREHNLGV